MAKQGIEFTMKNGEKENYDPINMEIDFKETETHYIMNIAYTYEVDKTEVESYRIYDLCKQCGREVEPNSDKCGNCI